MFVPFFTPTRPTSTPNASIMANNGRFREDDEAIARRLQYEEERVSLDSCSPSSRSGIPANRQLFDYRIEQEQSDLELARRFAAMDMQHSESAGESESFHPADDPFDYSGCFPRGSGTIRRHSMGKKVSNGSDKETRHRRRNTSANFERPMDNLQKHFRQNDPPERAPQPFLLGSSSPSIDRSSFRRKSASRNGQASPGFGNTDGANRSYDGSMSLSTDSDLELARKMQNLEDMGMGRLNSDRDINADDSGISSDLEQSQDTLEREDIKRLLRESGTSMEEVSSEVLSELMGESQEQMDNTTLHSLSERTPAQRHRSNGSLLANEPMVEALRMALKADKPNLSPTTKSLPVRVKDACSDSPTPSRRHVAAVPPPRFEPKTESTDTSTNEVLSSRGNTKKKKRGPFFRFGSKVVRPTDSDDNSTSEILDAHAVPVDAVPAAIPASIPSGIPLPPGGSLSAARATAGARSPPSAIPPAPLGGPPRPRAAGVPFVGTNVCAACGLSHGVFLKVFEQKYHLECFRCSSCSGKIDPNDQFKYTTDEFGKRHVHHRECFLSFGATCSVCNEVIPATPDGKIPYIKHPFFKSEQICVWHSEQPLRRCWSCHRFEPKHKPFVDLMDNGRVACRSCHRSAVVENADITPIWQQVLDFFETQMGLPVWGAMRGIPIFLVGSDALAEQWRDHDSIHATSSCLTTSGLCLEEMNAGHHLVGSLDSDISASSARAILGIICMTGLPKDLAGAVLAHEATHVWLRMHPKYKLGPHLPHPVEEGIAQLMAMLFLSEGLPPASTKTSDGPSDATLRQFFKFTIEREKSDIFGGGYRKAAVAYSDIGIEALLTHVLQCREFPKT